MSEKDVLLLVDSNSLMNRAFYALAGRSNMKAPDGTPTGALYAFLNMLFQYIELYNPKYLAAAFDLPGETFRHREYKDYKAGRKPMPDELAVQFPIARELLEALGFVAVATEDYEADDMIGTLAHMGEDAGLDVIILSGDKDLFQLITSGTKVQFLSSSKSGPQSELITRELFSDRYDVIPEQWVDVKALMGDASDNIPGVKGIGEKTALRLIKQYGSLTELYSKLTEEKGAVQRNLIAGEEQAYLSQSLAKIDCEVEIPESMNPLLHSADDIRDIQTIASMFVKLGFRSYFERFPELKKYQNQENNKGLKLLEEADQLKVCDSIDELIRSAAKTGVVAFLLPEGGLSGIAVSKEKYFLTDDMQFFDQLLAEPEIQFITWDIKQGLRESMHIADHSNVFDLMVAAYLLQEQGSGPDFDYTMQHLLGDSFLSASSQDADLPLLADQNAIRLKRAYQMLFAYPKQKQEIHDLDMDYLAEVEMHLAVILAAMEIRGIRVDLPLLEKNSDEMLHELDVLEGKVFDLAGREFNLNSPQQLSKLLFDERKLPPGKKTATAYSTAADELQRLYHLDPIIPLILEYRELAKLRSTFIEGLLKVVGEDGRVHTNFNQTITTTGRLSSSNPNLQNIPVRTMRGREIRKVFVAEPGRLLLGADYSQIELRLLAHLSQDESLLQAFRDGKDIHKVTAASLFHKDTDEINDDERAVAKTVNFSITYGISDFGLSRDLGVPISEAAGYIKRYHERYPRVIEWLESQAKSGKDNGFVETLFHRRRYLPELSSQNYNVQQFGMRAAMNAPVQGTAADLIKIAMVDVVKSLNKEKLDANILLQVHDELILEVAEEDIEQAAKILKNSMENVVKLDVPLVADTKIGPNWGEMK